MRGVNLPSQMLNSGQKRSIAVIALALMVYLIGNGRVSLWDRDEPRYAQTSRQMLQSGDWIVPKLFDEPREKKPVFIYWCQAASMAILGDNAFAARLPCVIGVSLTLFVLLLALNRSGDRERAFWTMFIFASAGLTMAMAKFCTTDGVLILFVVVAQLCLYEIWRGNRSWGIFIAMGLAVGFGMLTKGPVVPAVIATTLLVLAILRWFSPSPGTPGEGRGEGSALLVAKLLVAVAIACLILAPWLYKIEERLPGYTWRTIRDEVLVRTARPQEGHKGPPGYYLLTIWGTFLPWSLFLPQAIIRAWKNRNQPNLRFALAAIMGPWVMFEIVQTKLPHYLLPVYPALAYLVADWLIDRGKSLKGIGRLGLASFAFIAIAYSILPYVPPLRISQRVADVLVKNVANNPGDAVMIDYKEPSLAFYQGGSIRQRDNNYLVNRPEDQWPAWTVMTDTVWNQMPDEVKQRLEIVEKISGLNYAGKDSAGRHFIEVLVLRKR